MKVHTYLMRQRRQMPGGTKATGSTGPAPLSLAALVRTLDTLSLVTKIWPKLLKSLPPFSSPFFRGRGDEAAETTKGEPKKRGGGPKTTQN